MDVLTKRLAQWPGALAVAEPTSMTWLPLAIALKDAGVYLALVGNRHSARLRSAVAGKNKSDPIDASLLAQAGELFELVPARLPSPSELALRRAVQRRGKALVDANRCLRRLISQARWAFPDVWNACSGSRSTAIGIPQPVAPPRAAQPSTDLLDHRGGGRAHPRRRQRGEACHRHTFRGTPMGWVLGRSP
jgi:uncharacterized caspase-like protein